MIGSGAPIARRLDRTGSFKRFMFLLLSNAIDLHADLHGCNRVPGPVTERITRAVVNRVPYTPQSA